MSWLRSRWFGWVQLALGAIILYVVARKLLLDWDKVRASGVDLAFRPGWLLLSLGLVWLMWVGLIEGWRRIAVGWGAPLHWPLAGRIWMLSSFGKYLPGKVMAMAGMVALSERSGISGKVTLAAAIVMQVLGVGAGLAVAALTLGPAINDFNPNAGAAMTLLGLVAVGVLIAVGNRRFLDWVWPRIRRQGPAPTPPSVGVLGFGVLINAVTWLAYGLALVWLSRGLLPNADLGWRQATGAFTFAYLAGYLGPTPGGLGTRDAVLVLLLEHWVGLGPALALAAASRIAFTLNELGAAAPFFFTRESTSDLA